MNERQSQELQELEKLEAAGTLEDAQRDRFDELKEIRTLSEKADKSQKDFQTAEAQKKHFREKFEAEEKLRKEAEAKSAASGKGGETTKLGVDDFIGISTSLEGLDGKEKEYLAKQHTLSGKPLSEIRKDDDFLLWQSAYRQKVEKEKSTLPPTNRQPNSDEPISLEDALKGASLEEKEKILEESLGYSVRNKPRSDRTNIGR